MNCPHEGGRSGGGCPARGSHCLRSRVGCNVSQPSGARWAPEMAGSRADGIPDLAPRGPRDLPGRCAVEGTPCGHSREIGLRLLCEGRSGHLGLRPMISYPPGLSRGSRLLGARSAQAITPRQPKP
jgi:hypothetical protein